MPESERIEVADRVSEVDALLDRLGNAVGRVAAELASATERATRCEAAYEKLRQAVKGSDGGPVPANVEERLARLDEENRRLRVVLEEARTRASRIRTRLEVVEDEL